MEQILQPGTVKVEVGWYFYRCPCTLRYGDQVLCTMVRSPTFIFLFALFIKIFWPPECRVTFGERRWHARRAAKGQPHTAELVDEHGHLLATACFRDPTNQRIHYGGQTYLVEPDWGAITTLDMRPLVEIKLDGLYIRRFTVLEALPASTLVVFAAFMIREADMIPASPPT